MPKSDWVTPLRRIDKPWGHEEVFALVQSSYCGKMLHINEGNSLSLQYHERKDETVSVLRGLIRMEVGEHESELEVFDLEVGDCIRLMPLTRHRMTALTDACVLEASTTELEDVVRLEDRYGRAAPR